MANCSYPQLMLITVVINKLKITYTVHTFHLTSLTIWLPVMKLYEEKYPTISLKFLTIINIIAMG